MITILNICITYLLGMIVYAIFSGNILYWGAWRNRIQDKWQYYSGLIAHLLILVLMLHMRSLAEIKLTAGW